MKSYLADRLLEFIETHHLAQKGEKVLLAVSGGKDSTVMAHLFHDHGYSFGIAHCNFKLRGPDSDEDQAFVEELAQQFRVPFYHVSFNTTSQADTHKKSIQEMARDLRYQWLESIRAKEGYTSIAVAHHLNDQVETVLHHMIMGTGIRGLRGMKAKRGKIIRPLIFAREAELTSFVKEHQIRYREDASNKDTKYTRNKIRRELIPLLTALNPGFFGAFVESIQHFKDVEILYEGAIQAHRKKLLKFENGECHIPINLLLKYKAKTTLLYEIIRDYGFNGRQTTQIINSLSQQSGKQFLSPNYRIIKDRNFLIISPKTQPDRSIQLVFEHDSEVIFDEKKLSIKQLEIDNLSGKIPNDPSTAWLNSDKLLFPLKVRKWKKGDYFYPLGLKVKGKDKIGKKKISDFLTDLKIPLHKKAAVWVLESDKRIAWVIGLRIDDRFKITQQTKNIFQLKLTEK